VKNHFQILFLFLTWFPNHVNTTPATPLTGGGSLAAWTANVAVAGGITATADINIQNLKQQLITANTYNQYQTYFEGWDYFYNTVAVGEGILGGIQLSIIAKNINYTKAWNGFNNRIKNLADGSAVELIKARWRLGCKKNS
jgi:hypothetical protein